ncbi:UNVERIFIED_CONTAM: hypothetical protein HDU68_001089 [Siphonaria sp. JEL0065]|nr:hypothetical protein HDU68_001089 [Siphonaria sp. JEL0065]
MLFEDDDCICCTECCENQICCDDPNCDLPAAHPTKKASRRSATNFGYSSAFQTLLFFSVTVASASGQAAGELEPVSVSENSTLADACAIQELPEYDLPIHIAGIFIVLLVSGLGIFTTMRLGVHAKAATFARVLQILKMFGIGVIAATAWIHLLPDAFSQFGSPCLPEGWQEYGSAFVGLFGLTAAFLVQFIELTAIDYKNRRARRYDHKDSESVTLDGSENGVECTDLDHVAVSGNSAAFLEAGRIPNVRAAKPSKTIASGVSSSTPMSISDVAPAAHSGKDEQDDDSVHNHGRNSELGTILLECGIIFHSLIIGVTLGVTPGEDYITLLVAICFHQLFEGMALGVLIGNLKIAQGYKNLMNLAYPLTTPIGLVIGICVRHYYNENDGGLILTQGIFDSLSAGILFYNTYTELMSGEVSHNGHFHGFTSGFKAACFLAMYLGATAMAIVAIWA